MEKKKIVIALIILGLLYCIAVIMGWGLVVEVGTKLFGILPELTPVFIGAGIVYIAWQQWQTNQHRLRMEHHNNKDSLRMELFDKRFKVYMSIIEALMNPEQLKDEDIVSITRAQCMAAHFLFEGNPDIALFIPRAVEAITCFLDFHRQNNLVLCNNPTTHAAKLNHEQKKELDSLFKNNRNLAADASVLFTEYLMVYG